MMTEERTLELKIDQYTEFVANNSEKQLSSAPTYIHGLVWRIVVKKSEEPIARLIFLECTGGDDVPNWSCQANVVLHFVRQKEGINDEIYKSVRNFSKENDSGLLSRMWCNVLLNPNNGFIKDNTVIFRVRVKAEILQSVRAEKMTNLSNFASSISDPPDAVLIVGTNRIPIHKMYLSFYSDYFKTMFRSEFKESREGEIVIEEVEYEEMIELLSMFESLDIKYIREKFEYYKKHDVQYVMFFTKDNLDTKVKPIMKLMEVEFGITTQHVPEESMEKNFLFVGQVLMQFNLRLGGINHGLSTSKDMITANRFTQDVVKQEWFRESRMFIGMYLSFYSDYFKTMFRSEFKESREDEIVIEEVEYEEMIELLSVIYPSIAPITARNLKTILKLADRFIMPAVMERCKRKLRTLTFNGAEKLLLAQIYNLEDLQMEFAQQYKTAADAKKLKSEPEYSQLDNNTLALVFKSIAF